MGSLVIGDEASALSTVAPAPDRTLPHATGGTDMVYFLDGPERYPYLVATVRQDRIVALQITGPDAAKNFSFNNVGLGATIDVLTQYFGQPFGIEPSDLKDTELWSYDPWPFSFEITGGHVSSIRIVDPTQH
jgi:hypothetical protein